MLDDFHVSLLNDLFLCISPRAVQMIYYFFFILKNSTLHFTYWFILSHWYAMVNNYNKIERCTKFYYSHVTGEKTNPEEEKTWASEHPVQLGAQPGPEPWSWSSQPGCLSSVTPPSSRGWASYSGIHSVTPQTWPLSSRCWGPKSSSASRPGSVPGLQPKCSRADTQ